MATRPDDRKMQALVELQPYIERARTFSGWSFEDLDVKQIGPRFANGLMTPWDYVALAREHAARAERVIDLGTGGGEVYSRIIEGLASRFVASEEWHVNAPVAHSRLRPLGVDVVWASSERTPWGDESFDVVLSKHEAIVPEDIVRILRPGGMFLTQQVSNVWWQEITPFFPERTVFPDHFTEYRRGFEDAGLSVETQEHSWKSAYATIGEVAFMLMVTPWDIPDFDPVRDIDRLLALEEANGTSDGIVLTQASYLMSARKRPG